jgi:hypothetical protein
MSTANGTHRDAPVKHRVSNLKKALHKGEKSEGNDAAAFHDSEVKLFTFTVDAKTAQIIKFESLDASGAPHEFSDDEKVTLARQGVDDGLEALVEQAFEAGIACVLGEHGRSQSKESAQDAELRHLLLAPLIKHSLAKRLLEGEVLNRVLLSTLIQHSMKSGADNGAGASVGSVQ